MAKRLTKTKPKQLVCSICADPIQQDAWGWDQGHNAQPINDGRCCDTCNATRVIPTRLGRIMSVLEK